MVEHFWNLIRRSLLSSSVGSSWGLVARLVWLNHWIALTELFENHRIDLDVLVPIFKMLLIGFICKNRFRFVWKSYRKHPVLICSPSPHCLSHWHLPVYQRFVIDEPILIHCCWMKSRAYRMVCIVVWFLTNAPLITDANRSISLPRESSAACPSLVHLNSWQALTLLLHLVAGIT